jgi:RNA polymerase sigma factor for flagellar operon FliA
VRVVPRPAVAVRREPAKAAARPAAKPVLARPTLVKTNGVRPASAPVARAALAKANGALAKANGALAAAAKANGARPVAAALAAAPAAITYNKDNLLTRFAPLVRHVVERIATTLPRNVDHEDLYSAGVLGLLDAHAKFDAHKGVKFETYAVWRIKGAVLDQLRALDWASRSMRRKARNLDGVTRQLDQRLGRAASDEEVAKEMAMSREDFYRMLDQVRGAVLVSLDEARSGDEQEPTTLADHLPDPNGIDLQEKLAEEEDKLLLLRLLDQLPEQERVVVALYYYEHMTLKEIGRALGISESRVSQVHTRAMSRLRLRLQNVTAEAA